MMHIRIYSLRYVLVLMPFLAAGFLQGCGFAGGASILSSGMGNVTATGVERTLDGAAVKTFTVEQAKIVDAVERALSVMGFEEDDRIRSERHVRIAARSARRKVVVTVEPVARHASQVKVEANSGWILSEDPATATEIMDQVSAALKAPAG